VAKERGALVLAIVTLPFGFEGDRRRQAAFAGLEQLKAQADAVICIQNDKLFKAVGEKATVVDAFRYGDRAIARGVTAIWQLLARKGLVNLDFAALRTTLGSKHSDGVFSYGEGKGADKARDAVKALMENPLFDGSETLARAEGVLVSILGGNDLTLTDVQRAVEPISRVAARAQIIMGAAIDESQGDRLSVTVIATANILPKRGAQPTSVRTLVGRPSPMRPVAAPVPAKEPVPAAKKEKPQAKQESLPLDGVSRGRFDKSEPTLYDGEDLDVPAYIRRGISLRK
jgi:cell division protein FtsZ